MMSAPALRSATMLFAKEAWPLKAVAKRRLAPGARSCTISSIAEPSLPDPACPGRTTTPEGRSPDDTREARASTPSERTPTLTPLPSTPRLERASSA
jgi:hypothetical protein